MAGRHPYRTSRGADEVPQARPLLRLQPGSIALAISLSGPIVFILFCAAVPVFVPSTAIYGAIGYSLFVLGVIGWPAVRK